MNYLFDLDDTVYDLSQPFVRAFDLIFARDYPVDVNQLFIGHRVHSEETFARSERNEISMEDMYCYRITAAFRDQGYSITRQQALLFQNTYAEIQHKLILGEEMAEILDYCRDTDQFVQIVTNGPSEHQRKKISSLGLDKWMDTSAIVISSETGFRKPEREIFDIARERFNLDLNKTYFVGDNVDTDILGAHNAGWKSIWFNHRHHPNNTGVTPDYTVYSYRQLLQLIKNLT